MTVNGWEGIKNPHVLIRCKGFCVAIFEEKSSAVMMILS